MKQSCLPESIIIYLNSIFIHSAAAYDWSMFEFKEDRDGSV